MNRFRLLVLILFLINPYFVHAKPWVITNIDVFTQYEHVDQDGFNKDANALTFRVRPSIETKAFNGLSIFADADIIIGNDQYNSTDNGVTDRPRVSIPEDEEINQFYLSYQAENITSKLGRQRILLDNGRIIGNVQWRQNEQTMDAFSLNYNRDRLNGYYAYVDKVNRIFGNNHSNPVLAEFDVSAHFLNASYNFSDREKITAYSYLIDNKNSEALSSNTFGVAYKNIYKNLLLKAELAKQQDYADAPEKSENYFKLETTLHHRGLNFTAGHERLTGNGEASFSTPLANWHTFNGWVDTFVNVPEDGLKDSYAAISGNALGLILTAKYHDFSAENSDAKYGDEWGLTARKNLKNGKFVAKYATYNADQFAKDTDKFWLIWRQNFNIKK